MPPKNTLTHAGTTQTLYQWSKQLGIGYYTLYARYKQGIRPPELFIPPAKSPLDTVIAHNGQELTLREWADKLQIPRKTLTLRFQSGRTDPVSLLAPKFVQKNRPLPTPHTAMLSFNRKRKSIYDWCKLLHLPYAPPFERYLQGARRAEAIFANPDIRTHIKRALHLQSLTPRITDVVEHNKQYMTLKEISKQSGISYRTIKYRYKKGLRDAALVAPPAVIDFTPKKK